MKKVLTIIIALTLVLIISGCDDIELKKTEEYYCENDYNGEWNNTFQQCIFETYSQEEVDELLLDLDSRISTRNYNANKFLMENLEIRFSGIEQRIVENELNITELDMNDLNFYTEDELDLLFNELGLYILELEARIEELEGEPIVYTGCNMVSLLWEFGEAIDDGYTLDLVNGNLVEYKNGIATGDIFTNQDLLDDYCTTGE